MTLPPMPDQDTAASRADRAAPTFEEAERRLAGMGSADASALWEAYAEWLATIEPNGARGVDRAERLQARRRALRTAALYEAGERGYQGDPTAVLAAAVERGARTLASVRWTAAAAAGEAVRDVTLAYLLRDDLDEERFEDLIEPWLEATRRRAVTDRSFDVLGLAALATGVLALAFCVSGSLPAAAVLAIGALALVVLRARARRRPPDDTFVDYGVNGPPAPPWADDEPPADAPHPR